MTDHFPPTQYQAGFSIIELMVAMTLGLLLMIGLVSVVINTNRSYGELSKASLRLENGRYAMQVLGEDIRHAGFYGEYYTIGSPPIAMPSDLCYPTLADLQSTMPLHILGYDKPATPPSSLSNCLPSANHLPGTDILVIRHASTAITPINKLKDSKIYLQTLNDDVEIDAGGNTSTFEVMKKKNGDPADIREYHVDIYFISPCSNSTCTADADGGNPIPTLKRLKLIYDTSASKPKMFTEPLIEGIENLQIEYGIDRIDTAMEHDGAPNEDALGAKAYVASPTITEWPDVVALRLFLLVRNIQRNAGYKDAKTYHLGLAGDVGPFKNDDALAPYKRHVFSTAVRVINPSSRRETP